MTKQQRNWRYSNLTLEQIKELCELDEMTPGEVVEVAVIYYYQNRTGKDRPPAKKVSPI